MIQGKIASGDYTVGFNFRKFFGIIILSCGVIFLLAACIFTATDYVPASPTPVEPQEEGSIRVFNGVCSRWTDTGHTPSNSQFTNILDTNLSQITVQTFFSNLSGSIRISFALILSTVTEYKEILFRNLHLLVDANIATPTEYQTKFLSRYLFIGRFNGLSHTKLVNSFGNYAIISNDSQMLVRFRELFEVHQNYNMYVIIIDAREVNRPSWTGTNQHGNVIRALVSVNYTSLYSLLGANYISTRKPHLGLISFSQLGMSPHSQPSSVDELPTDLRPTEPGIPDDSDIVNPSPEIPGTDNGTTPPPPTDDNGYPEVIYRDNWWTQFRAWLRRLLFA